jgi:hypothetical protein
MYGIAAALNQSKYSIEPPISTRNSEGHAWLKPKMTETYDVGQVESTELLVVRDVQKDCVGTNAKKRSILSSHARSSARFERFGRS